MKAWFQHFQGYLYFAGVVVAVVVGVYGVVDESAVSLSGSLSKQIDQREKQLEEKMILRETSVRSYVDIRHAEVTGTMISLKNSLDDIKNSVNRIEGILESMRRTNSRAERLHLLEKGGS